MHSKNQTHAGKCSLLLLESAVRQPFFAFGAVEKEQQCGIDHFSLLAFRTDTRASVTLARRKTVPEGRLEV